MVRVKREGDSQAENEEAASEQIEEKSDEEIERAR